MKTVVYLDVLLLVNFLTGFLMVGVVGLITGRPPAFFRQVLGGGAAAAVSLSILLPPLPWLLQLIWQLAGCCLVVMTAFGKMKPGGFLLRTGLLWGENLLLAGVVILSCLKLGLPGVHTNNLQVYLYVSPQVLFWCSAGVYGAGWLFSRLWGNRTPQPVYLLELRVADTLLPVRGMVDTGFVLRDDWSGRPVVLLSLPAVGGELDPVLAAALEDWRMGQGTLPRGARLLPCATVGGNTLLPALPGEIGRPGEGTIRVLAAFTGERFRAGEEAEALLGPDLARLLELL